MKDIWIHHGEQDLGPFTDRDVAAGIATGQFSLTDDHFFTEGMADWEPLANWKRRPDPTPPPLPVALPAVRQPWNLLSTSHDQATLLLLLAAFAPLLWAPLIIASLGMVIGAFVLSILAIVRGRPIIGTALIAACPFALFFAWFVSAEFALRSGTTQEKIEAIRREGAEAKQQIAEREEREKKREETKRRLKEYEANRP